MPHQAAIFPFISAFCAVDSRIVSFLSYHPTPPRAPISIICHLNFWFSNLISPSPKKIFLSGPLSPSAWWGINYFVLSFGGICANFLFYNSSKVFLWKPSQHILLHLQKLLKFLSNYESSSQLKETFYLFYAKYICQNIKSYILYLLFCHQIPYCLD